MPDELWTLEKTVFLHMYSAHRLKRDNLGLSNAHNSISTVNSSSFICVFRLERVDQSHHYIYLENKFIVT